MEPTETNWIPCLVFGATGSIAFGCPLKAGISVLIPARFNVKIGDFVDIKFKPNPTCNPNYRAQHLATDIRTSITQRPRITVIDEKIIFFYTFAEVREFDMFENKRVTLLYNETFGSIIDLNQELPKLDIGTVVELKCRLKESPLRKKSTIFIVSEYNKENIRLPMKNVSSVNDAPASERKMSQLSSGSIVLQKPLQMSSKTQEHVAHIPRLCDLSFPQMPPCDQQQDQRTSGQSGNVEPNVSSTQKAVVAKSTNKYASKSKAEMLVHIFDNDVMMDALRKRDKDLWAHVANIIAMGE